MKQKLILFLGASALLALVGAQYNPNFVPGRTTIVHLFEWKWNDIATECETFLGPNGFAGVQVSPPNENVAVYNGEKIRPWWERYQPVSYKLETRSGTEQEFIDMVKRCNAVGVRIYVDAVINHMSGYWDNGTLSTGNSTFSAAAQSYPGVPFNRSSFHQRDACPTATGEIESYQDIVQIRNCKLSGLNDLDHAKADVRAKIVEYLNRLLSYGVAGFRIDASKHMWPAEIQSIVSMLTPLSTNAGFNSGARPFIYQEVIDLGTEPIKASEYFGSGRVTEFKICASIGNIFRRNKQRLSYMKNWGEGWAMMPSMFAFVFVDNHDNQRGHGAGGESILTFRVPRLYKMAQAFTLAWPYGITRVMSSYNWTQKIVNGQDLNDWVGPPRDGNDQTLSVEFEVDGKTCKNGWVCEHRWREIANMVKFRNVVEGAPVANWWDNGSNQAAFARLQKGFIAINNDDFDLNQVLQTSLPAGTYCDVISGDIQSDKKKCNGKAVVVQADGKATISISNTEETPVIAIHVASKLM